jgi:hypothetical protein
VALPLSSTPRPLRTTIRKPTMFLARQLQGTYSSLEDQPTGFLERSFTGNRPMNIKLSTKRLLQIINQIRGVFQPNRNAHSSWLNPRAQQFVVAHVIVRTVGRQKY